MKKRHLQKLARKSPDSCVQLLLEDPLNVWDALNFAAPAYVSRNALIFVLSFGRPPNSSNQCLEIKKTVGSI